jgi:hypothetical protein
MPKFFLLTAASAALVIGPLFFFHTARADSLSCASVNGVTQCTGSDGLDCHTVDGRMVCAPGSIGSCETVGEVTICRNGSVTQTFRTGPLSPRKPHGEEPRPPQRESDTRLGDSSGAWLSIQQDHHHGQHVSIERFSQTLRMLGLDKD